MRILSAFYFSGGKITPLWTTTKNKFKENWRMRILSTPYFSKFFGGKITNFEQRFALKNVSKKQHKNSVLFLNLS